MGRWLRILPDAGGGYLLYGVLEGRQSGRILFDAEYHWIYDGDVLGVEEQEEVAGAIGGYQQEMETLVRGGELVCSKDIAIWLRLVVTCLQLGSAILALTQR